MMMTVVSYCKWACCMRAYRFCYVKKYCPFFLDKNVTIKCLALHFRFREGKYRPGNWIFGQSFVIFLSLRQALQYHVKRNFCLFPPACQSTVTLTNLLSNTVFFELLRVSHCATRRKVAGSISDGVLNLSLT